jgi:penicillin-binding protein 1A
VIAHQNYRTIPPIPGLGLDANQIAEQQRLQELRRTDPAMAQAQIAQATQKPSSSIMPDQTKVVLKKLSDSLRQAAGLQPTPASVTPSAPPATPKGPPPPEQKAKPVGTPERRAEGPGTSPRP